MTDDNSMPATSAGVGKSYGMAPPAAMEWRVSALRASGTEIQFLIVPVVGHDFGPETGTNTDAWLDEAVRFWEKFQQ